MPLNSFDKELISSNLLGATTLKDLHRKEKLLTNTKMLTLQENPIEGNLDYAHLKVIHYFLFSEVYSWAGQDRYDANITAKFGKDTTLFTSYEKLPPVSKILFDALDDENYFRGQSKVEFIESASIFMNGLNILHPFREGNGRVQRVYMQYLAKNAGYELNFEKISSKEMEQASIEGAQGKLTLLREIFIKSIDMILKDK
jgi:cell filamentation protein